MTVPSENSRMDYAGDDVTTVFPYDFYIFEDADLLVTKKLIASPYTETILVLDTDYTVSGAGDPVGGNVTLTVALPDEYNLIILRNLSILQEMNLITNDAMPAESIEQAFDRLTMICQQLKEQIDRDILLNLPSLVTGYLYNDGVAMSWSAITTVAYAGAIGRGADASKAAVPSAGDIYIATDTYKLYVCYVTGTWTCLPDISDMAAKTSLVDNDVFLLEDSAAAYIKKKITRANLKTDMTDACVKLTGNQTVAGIKTFSSFPVTPSSAPTTNYQVANKKYVDDYVNAVAGYGADLTHGVDNTEEHTLATVVITTVSGYKVMINGNLKITPNATVDQTITIYLYRNTTLLYSTTSLSEGADTSAYCTPFVPVNYLDLAAGSAATTYTLKAKASSASPVTIDSQLSVVQVK